VFVQTEERLLDVFVSTVIRGAPLAQGGELIRIDWDSKRIVGRVPIAPFDPAVNDANPRGNSRGGRGILFRDGSLIVASYHSLHMYDLGLSFKGKITHPLLVGLHELAMSQDVIYTTATSIDAVVAIDLNGNLVQTWWPRESSILQEHLSITAMNIDKHADNRLRFLDEQFLKSNGHLHLNAVVKHEGIFYVLFNTYGMVYDMTNDKIILEDPMIAGCHNLVVQNEHIFINDTRGRRLVIYDLQGSLVKAIDLMKFPQVAAIYNKARNRIGDFLNRLQRQPLVSRALKILRANLVRIDFFDERKSIARPIFLRGLYPLRGHRVLMSFSPATVIEVDYVAEKLLGCCRISNNIDHSPHGLFAIE
jgi:hypothetical protein